VDTGTAKLLAEFRMPHVAVVTLNNPEHRNALTRQMMSELPALLTRMVDLDARVIVITGQGAKAFAAGADLTELDHHAAGHVPIAVAYEAMLDAVRNVPVPTISMVRGACLGGGLELALMTDLRYAAEVSSFGIPAVRLGLAYARVEPLVALLGPSRTAELLFGGERIDAAGALGMGLLNSVLAAGELESWVLEKAASIARNAPLAVRAVKLALREASKDPSARDEESVRKAVQVCLDSADFAEGRRAFLEKRTPGFIGA
jgi:enoyl-CoA hydratase